MHYLYLLMLLCISIDVNASCIKPEDINTIENYSKGWQQGDAVTPLVEDVKNTISEVKKCDISSIMAVDLYYLAKAHTALGALRQLELLQAKVAWREIYIDEQFIKLHKKQEEYYNQTILTDDREPFELSVYQYGDMVVGLPDELKVIAYSRMLKTPQYGENDDIRTGDYFQYSNAYYRMGEYDKAIEVLNQMLAEKKAGNTQLNVTNKYIQSRIQEAENKKVEVAQSILNDQYATTKTIDDPYSVGEASHAESSATPEVAKVEMLKVEALKGLPDATAEVSEEPIWVVTGGAVLLFLLLGWYVVYCRRKDSDD